MLMSTSPEARTRKAREAFNAKFPDEESRSEYFRSLGKRSAERITLSAEEARALASAYDLLGNVAARVRRENAEAAP